MVAFGDGSMYDRSTWPEQLSCRWGSETPSLALNDADEESMRDRSARAARRGRSVRRSLRVVVRPAGDGGLTLVDVLVSMTIMTVVMAMFTSGIVQMYGMVNGTDSKSVAQSQVSIALLRLDKDIRYASGISIPYLLSGNQHVDFLLPTAGSPMCVQLRVAAGKLQRRTWTWNVNPFAAKPWVTLASGITSPTPFSYTGSTTDIVYQRLTVDLKATAGSGAAVVTRNNKVTYTALNTTAKSTNNDCIAGRSGV
jgi:hypothetical protein